MTTEHANAKQQPVLQALDQRLRQEIVSGKFGKGWYPCSYLETVSVYPPVSTGSSPEQGYEVLGYAGSSGAHLKLLIRKKGQPVDATTALTVPLSRIIFEERSDGGQTFPTQVTGSVRDTIASRLDAGEAETVNTLHQEMYDAFVRHDLLSCIAANGYAKVREELRRMEFIDLLQYSQYYAHQVSALELAYRAQPVRQMPHVANLEELERFQSEIMLQNAKNASTNDGQYARYEAKNSPRSKAEGPTLSIYINPRIECAAETVRILDHCLADCTGDMKTYFIEPDGTELGVQEPDGIVKEISEENPLQQLRQGNGIVVYFSEKDLVSQNIFFHRLNAILPSLGPLLRPTGLRDIMCTAKIPLTPGITYVERGSGDSWDRQKENRWKTPESHAFENWPGDRPTVDHRKQHALILNWLEGRKPSKAAWTSAMQLRDDVNRERLPNMPGLRRKESE